MTDTLTPEKRHANMAAIRSKNTRPELVVRKGLWKRGFRYRLNDKRLPGHPDLVLRKYRTVIFVNGCFWHGHEGCKAFRIPKTNSDFWQQKINRNRQRDTQERQQLVSLGWHCITVWECELTPTRREHTLDRLEYCLNDILLRNHRPRSYDSDDSPLPLAAEDSTL